MRAVLAGCALVAAALVGLPAAVAAPPASPTSFAGTCSVQGTVSFDPPASNTPAALRYDYAATGSCTGTLNGRSVTGAPVSLEQSGRSYGGCQSAHTTTPGAGHLVFSRTVSLAYNLDFTTEATEVLFDIHGRGSGDARARGSFLTARTSPDLFTGCAGAGVRRAPMDLTMVTESPLVSGGRSDSGAATAAPTLSGSCQLHVIVRFIPPGHGPEPAARGTVRPTGNRSRV